MSSIPMVVAAWNTQGGAHDKFGILDERLRPDVAVLSEMAKPSLLAQRGLDLSDWEALWCGRDDNKGLGVLVRRPLRLRALANPGGPLLEWILPVSVSDRTGVLLTVVAVWAANQDAILRHPPEPCDRQPTQAATVYRELVVDSPAT